MLSMMQQIIDAFANAIISALPLSPFQPYISEFSSLPYMGYVNWFLPIGKCIIIGASWGAAIGLFYLYSIVMRWVKMFGD